MSEVKLSTQERDWFLYVLGVTFSESRGVDSSDSNLLKWNGGTCYTLYMRAIQNVYVPVEMLTPRQYDFEDDLD